LIDYHGGDLLSRAIGDIAQLENFYVRGLAPPLVAVVVSIVSALYLNAFGPGLAATLLVFFIASGLGVTLLAHWLGRSSGKELVEVRAAMNAGLVDTIQGMADLLALGFSTRQRKELSALGQRYGAAQMRMARLSGLQSALSLLLANLAMWVILVQSIALVADGRVHGIYLAVLVLAALSSFEALTPLPLAAQYLGSDLAAARRLFQIIDEQPAAREPAHPSPRPESCALEVQELRFRYPSVNHPLADGLIETPALDGLSFSLRPGGRLAIVGPSGAGKTTLVNLLLRFWDYTDGAILLAGRGLRSYRQEDVQQLVSLVSQDTYLFNTTLRENLLIARPSSTDAELIQAIHQAQLYDFIRSLPEGLDTWIGEQGYRLSGGERQRLAISRALLKNAPLLILDEPTANLDALTERRLLEALYSLMDGRTTLVITHRLVGLEAMDEILVLDRGRVVERGRHVDLFNADGLYRRMWELQYQVLRDT
jgi:thiol reductant ABC exporter CydC subunit